MEYIKKEFQKYFGEIPVVKIWKQNGQKQYIHFVRLFQRVPTFHQKLISVLQWYLGIGIYIRVDKAMKSGSLVISMSTHYLSFVCP